MELNEDQAATLVSILQDAGYAVVAISPAAAEGADIGSLNEVMQRAAMEFLNGAQS